MLIAAERFELYKRPGASKTFAYEQVDELTGILRLTTFDNAGRLRSCFLRQLSFVTSLSLVDSR